MLNQDDLDSFESGDLHSDLDSRSPRSTSELPLVPEPWRYPTPPEFEPQLSAVLSSLGSDKRVEPGDVPGAPGHPMSPGGVTMGASPVSITTGAPVMATPFAAAPAVAIAAAAAAEVNYAATGATTAAAGGGDGNTAAAAAAGAAPMQRQLSRKFSKTGLTAAGGRGGTAVRRPGMVGSTPVHLAVQDSPLTTGATWQSRHEGMLNLMLVIVVASNIR